MNAFDLRPRGVGPESTKFNLEHTEAGLQSPPPQGTTSLGPQRPCHRLSIHLRSSGLASRAPGFGLRSIRRRRLGRRAGKWPVGLPADFPFQVDVLGIVNRTGSLHGQFYFEASAFEAVRLASLMDF